jgi:hypothetical protein
LEDLPSAPLSAGTWSDGRARVGVLDFEEGGVSSGGKIELEDHRRCAQDGLEFARGFDELFACGLWGGEGGHRVGGRYY